MKCWTSTAAALLAIVAATGCATARPAPASAPRAREGYWSINGTRLHYRIVGRGKTLVLLHGGPGGNLHSWQPLEVLADRYRLVMYDQRGTGESDRLPIDGRAPDPTLISVERNIADLEAIRRRLGLREMVLIGHSWGGTLAAFYAGRYPQHVERMVIYNGGPVWEALGRQKDRITRQRLSPQSRRAVARELARLRAELPRWSQQRLDGWFVDLARHFFPTMVCDPSVGDAPELGRGGFWANQLTNRYEKDFDPVRFAKKLAAVRAPVLLTWGRCEVSPIERQIVLRDALPRAQLVIFDKSGHQALVEQPALFLRTLVAFLEDSPLPLAPFTKSAAQAPPISRP